jgi:hypothetical protein
MPTYFEHDLGNLDRVTIGTCAADDWKRDWPANRVRNVVLVVVGVQILPIPASVIMSDSEAQERQI